MLVLLGTFNQKVQDAALVSLDLSFRRIKMLVLLDLLFTRVKMLVSFNVLFRRVKMLVSLDVYSGGSRC